MQSSKQSHSISHENLSRFMGIMFLQNLRDQIRRRIFDAFKQYFTNDA